MYFYRLKQIDFDGKFNYSNIIKIDFQHPMIYLLFQNYPNPFNSSTVIEYQISKRSKLNIAIYNVLGEKVITLFNDIRNPGIYKTSWDGINNSGNHVASGIYFCKMRSEGFTNIKKLVVIE